MASTPEKSRWTRRRLLKLGASAGVLGGAAAIARYTLLPPGRSSTLDSVDGLARRLFESLDDQTKRLVCVDYDHPYRQYHNRGVDGGGHSIWRGPFSWSQRQILTDLLYAGLSERGRERVPSQFFINWPGIHLLKLLICGDPTDPPYQLILTGPHLNLRLGGKSREGVAFGGPQIYGDQRGDGQQGLPSNVYRYQLELGDRLFRTLSREQQRRTLLAAAPIQTQIELRGRHGTRPGVAVADLSDESRAAVRATIDGILENYPDDDVAYAWECLEHNGGVDSLALSYYADSEVGQSGVYQVYRLEGPTAVLYFRGHPHVHAFVNIGRDGDRPLSVGKELGENPSVLEGTKLKALFESAMREHADSDLAYYHFDGTVGRIRTGVIRTGDIYNAESWQDHIAVVEVEGSKLHPEMVETLKQRGVSVDSTRRYRIATSGHVASELAAEKLGGVESRERAGLIRDATIAYLERHGFPRT